MMLEENEMVAATLCRKPAVSRRRSENKPTKKEGGCHPILKNGKNKWS